MLSYTQNYVHHMQTRICYTQKANCYMQSSIFYSHIYEVNTQTRICYTQRVNCHTQTNKSEHADSYLSDAEGEQLYAD